jgi:pimeloyl-ACP methyl ester carboxylesterase
MQWHDFADADFTALSDLADKWRAYVGHLEEYGNVLAEDVSKKLGEDVFEGADAVAARDRVARIHDAITGDVLERAASVRDGLTDAYDALQAEVENYGVIEVDAGNLRLAIQNNGTVTRIQQTVLGTEETTALQQQINGLEARVAECLGRFESVDANLANTLRMAIEEPSELPLPIGENPDRKDIPTGPEHVADWWAGLDPMERNAYLEAFPDFLGGLDGMPADARNIANQDALESEVSSLNSEISSIESQIAALEASGDHMELGGRGGMMHETDEYQALKEQLAELQGKHDDATGLQENMEGLKSEGKDVYLLDYSLDGDGQAVVSIGNPDTADNTAVHVPGTYSELSNFGTQMDRANTMHEDALWAAPGEETAVIAWLGYDAPDDLAQASDPQLAHDATGDLDSFMNGLDAAHQGEDSHTTLMGHSYGSAVAGDTVRTYEGVADELITVASPGTTAQSAEELNIDEDHIWSTTAEGDAIELPSATPILGYDATQDHFGGNVFTSDAVGEDGRVIDSGPLTALGDEGKEIHGGYWRDIDEDGDGNADYPNTARNNIANIITGNTDAVELVE